MGTGRQRRFRNPKKYDAGGAVMKVLPWVAIAALVYLMGQNASKLKSGSGAVSTPSTGSAGCVDFGVTSSCAWS